MAMPSQPMPEIRTFAATDFDLPEELGRLRELAYNFWWSWSPEARMLFSSIHPQLWARYRNPVEVLLNVDPHRCVVIEDAIAGVAAGKRGGFGLVVSVARGANADELKRHGADVVVGDLGELLERER